MGPIKIINPNFYIQFDAYHESEYEESAQELEVFNILSRLHVWVHLFPFVK